MPTISIFYGILIRMFFNDHAPPISMHGLASSRQQSIFTLEVLDGKLPQRALSLAQEWGNIHKEELLANWQRCRYKAAPANIKPLP